MRLLRLLRIISLHFCFDFPNRMSEIRLIQDKGESLVNHVGLAGGDQLGQDIESEVGIGDGGVGEIVEDLVADDIQIGEFVEGRAVVGA